MRRLSNSMGAASALLLVTSNPASAGTFTSGTLGISIGALPTVTLSDNGPDAFTITAGGSFTEPAGAFGPATLPLPRALFTGIPQISGLTLIAARDLAGRPGFGNGTKVITAAGSPGGGLGGVGGLRAAPW